MSEIRVNKVIDEAGTGAVELTQGATIPTGKTLSGAGSISIGGDITATGNISVGGTLTYDDVTNIDSVGLITARSGINVTGGNTTVKGAVETVNAGAYSGVELTCDTATGTVFTHDLQDGLIQSIRISNFPTASNSFHTVTLVLTQNDAGTGHTLAASGIGTNVTLVPTGVSPFTKAVKVGLGNTITLGATANDVNIVTLGVHYNGGTNTNANNYNVFITKSGDFR
jgi:hypothetical protein